MKWVIYLEGLRREAHYLKQGTMGEWIAWAQIILKFTDIYVKLKASV